MERKDKLQELYDQFGGDPRAVAAASEEELRAAQARVYKDKFLPNGWSKEPEKKAGSAWTSDAIDPDGLKNL